MSDAAEVEREAESRGYSRNNSIAETEPHLRYRKPRPNLHSFDRGFNPLDYDETVKQLDLYYGIGKFCHFESDAGI